MDSKAQISIEMIVVLGAIVAMAFFMLTTLEKTGRQGAEIMQNKASDLFERVKTIE